MYNALFYTWQCVYIYFILIYMYYATSCNDNWPIPPFRAAHVNS